MGCTSCKHADDVEDEPSRWRHAVPRTNSQLLMRPDERQESADEQRERTGVGAVVDARRIGMRVEQQDHLEGRQHDEHDDAFLHRRTLDARFHADEQGDRPDQVELLFN